MTVDINGLVKVVATFLIGSVSRAQNVYHFTNVTTGGSTDQEIIDCALDWVEEIMANIADKITTDVSLEQIECYEYVLGDWQPLGTKAGTFVGTASGDRLPAGVALQLNAYKERSGYADKKFICGISETYCTADAWASGLITQAEAAIADWVADYTDGTTSIKPASVSYATGVATFYSGDELVKSTPSYQRRRKPGVGLT